MAFVICRSPNAAGCRESSAYGTSSATAYVPNAELRLGVATAASHVVHCAALRLRADRTQRMAPPADQRAERDRGMRRHRCVVQQCDQHGQSAGEIGPDRGNELRDVPPTRRAAAVTARRSPPGTARSRQRTHRRGAPRVDVRAHARDRDVPDARRPIVGRRSWVTVAVCAHSWSRSLWSWRRARRRQRILRRLPRWSRRARLRRPP